jgi:DNA-binding MarR family transcriptional regulator
VETETRIERAMRRLSRGAHLGRLHRSLNAAAGLEMDRPAYIALACLAEQGPLTLSALAEASAVDVSTMSRLVDRLVAGELVAASRLPDDQRVTVLRLSPAGAAAVERLKTVRRTALMGLLADWTPAERATFAALLTRFVDGLEGLAAQTPTTRRAAAAAVAAGGRVAGVGEED